MKKINELFNYLYLSKALNEIEGLFSIVEKRQR